MEKEALSFNTFVSAQEDGQLHSDLTKALREIVAQLNNAVMEHGGVHTASLKLDLSFKIDGGAIECKADTKATLPKEKRPRTIYWATADNYLTRRNPKQLDIPFRDVNAPAVRDIEHEQPATEATA